MYVYLWAEEKELVKIERVKMADINKLWVKNLRIRGSFLSAV